MTERLIRIPEVCQKIGLGRSSVYDLMEKSDFPRPLRISPRYVAWRESEIDKWIEERVAERDRQSELP